MVVEPLPWMYRRVVWPPRLQSPVGQLLNKWKAFDPIREPSEKSVSLAHAETAQQGKLPPSKPPVLPQCLPDSYSIHSKSTGFSCVGKEFAGIDDPTGV